MTYQRYVRLGLIVFSVVLLMIILVKAQDNSTNKSQGTSAKSPDQLFDQGMYADALKGYEALYTTAKGDEQWKALYRMIECKGMLFRWGEALQMIVDMKMPEERLWRARFLIMRANLYRDYLSQYEYTSRTDIVEGDKDVTRRTPKEMHAEIQKDYDELYLMKSSLIVQPLSEEGYFIDIRLMQANAYPSLWDFVVLQWTDYLLQGLPDDPKIAKPKALDLLGTELDNKLDKAHPIMQAALLMEEASRLERKAEWVEGGELWKVRRLVLAYSYSYRLTGEDGWKAEYKAGIATLTAWLNLFKGVESQAEAGNQRAEILKQDQQSAAALLQCESVKENWGTSFGAKKCDKLIAEITRPELNLQIEANSGPHQNPAVNSRNVKQIYCRIYATTLSEMKKYQPEYDKSWAGIFYVPTQETLEHFILERKPHAQWSQEIKLPQLSGIYEETRSMLKLPSIEQGIYMMIVSNESGFKPGESLIQGAVLNNTDIILIGTSVFDKPQKEMLFIPGGILQKKVHGFNFYVFDGKTGSSLRDVDIDVYSEEKNIFLRTDSNGMAQFPVKIDLHPHESDDYYADPLAHYRKSYAYWQGPAYQDYSVPEPISLHIDTDRPIYRPGQKVQYKVTMLMKVPEGLKVYRTKSKLSIAVKDRNNQEFYREDKDINSMGSCNGEFMIPAGRMLGTYTIKVSVQEWGYHFGSDKYFQVEEYKRPEFEVVLADAKGPWRLRNEAVIEGDVRYYFGGAVPDAPITLRITRQEYIPWFCWWWSWRSFNSDQNEILKKELKTDSNGHFTFTFTAEASDPHEKDPVPQQFTVEVEARDSGGRTITGKKTYVAGKNAYLFSIEPPAGYFMSGTSLTIPTQIMNLNEKAMEGTATWAVYYLDKDPVGVGQSVDEYGYAQEPVTLERICESIPDGPREATGSLKYDGKQPAPIVIKALKPGAHRLTLKTTDPWGNAIAQSIILVVADASTKTLPVRLTNLAIAEHQEYKPGDRAYFLIGSHHLEEPIHVEVVAGKHMIAHYFVSGKGIRVFEFPLTDAHKGGFSLRWFAVKDFVVNTGITLVKVPWIGKNLTAQLHYDTKLTPGQKASWSLETKDSNGLPVDGEALVGMYDRSLEYYKEFESSWLNELYQGPTEPGTEISSLFSPWIGDIMVEKGWIKKILDQFNQAIQEPEPPMLRLERARLKDAYGDELQEVVVMGTASNAIPRKQNLAAHMGYLGSTDLLKHKGLDVSPPPPPPPPPRTNFAETAFFEPQLAIKNGTAQFSFQVPEQLTGWRIRAQVLTEDVKTGLLSEETVTQKDLMVRVEIPRFFREGDEGTIKAVVHNETDAELTGELALSVTEDGKPAEELLALKDPVRSFSVKPHSIQPFAWTIRIPRKITAFKVKAVARGNQLADAEERAFPVLPTRQRLIETKFVALNGDATKTISMKAFEKPDPTRQNESMILQIDPQLALTILNSIPFLVKYPYECVEQLVNRYVPLAIVNEVYKKYPNIAKAVDKIPKRETITPEWDRTDSRRMISLMETPWEELSKGYQTQLPVINMLEPNLVKSEKEDALNKLIQAQLPSGAFPWFPGGHEDVYMTLYVLAGFAEANRYGIEIPKATVQKALKYVMNEIPKRLKPEEADLVTILYAAYVVTSYPKDFDDGKLSYTFAQAWIDFADKHSNAMTPYGKALAAYTYWRLGNKQKGDSYLDRAMDGAREDEIAGVYFAPEKNSWLWYNDTVEMHAFLLKTLQAMRPDDPRIPGMVQWLIFNRKGNEWKSTKASSAAVYALLDFMQAKGALDKGDQFSVTWGDVKDSVQVQPDSWLDKPIRWTKTGADIVPAYGTPKIEKKGPGFAFGSLTWLYSTEQVTEPSESGLVQLQRTFYLRVKEADGYHLKPLQSGDTVNVGDEIEVQLKINTRSQFEYMHLKDPKGAGFEAEELLSGWKWDQIGRYEEVRDSLTNFFISWLPQGEYILRYRIRPTIPGKYNIGAAILQSMYAPEFSAHSGSITLTIGERGQVLNL